MKKTWKFRNWVVYTLVTINIILFILMSSECDDLKMFILSKIILTIIFLFNNLLLSKHSNLFEED